MKRRQKVKTLIGTPETPWKPIYGVCWGGHSAPLCDYEDLAEAMTVAVATRGRVMVRWRTETDWGVL